jgi:hypothetical protein
MNGAGENDRIGRGFDFSVPWGHGLIVPRGHRSVSFIGCRQRNGASVLWFAAIQSIKRNQDLADLPPKRCFVTAKAVKNVVGQAGKA